MIAAPFSKYLGEFVGLVLLFAVLATALWFAVSTFRQARADAKQSQLVTDAEELANINRSRAGGGK